MTMRHGGHGLRLKAFYLIARGNHPGGRFLSTHTPCKGKICVPMLMPLQGADILIIFRPGVVTPGYKIKGFQP